MKSKLIRNILLSLILIIIILIYINQAVIDFMRVSDSIKLLLEHLRLEKKRNEITSILFDGNLRNCYIYISFLYRESVISALEIPITEINSNLLYIQFLYNNLYNRILSLKITEYLFPYIINLIVFLIKHYKHFDNIYPVIYLARRLMFFFLFITSLLIVFCLFCVPQSSSPNKS